MKREASIAAVGAVLGATVIYFTFSPPSSTAPASRAGAATETAVETAAVPDPAATTPGSTAAHLLAVSERAAALTDTPSLLAEIERTAAEPDSFRRTLQLNLLLDRLTELDPRQAIDMAETLPMDTRTLERLYRIRIRDDHEAVLTDLDRVTPPALRRAVALALLDVYGDDDDAIQTVAAHLLPVERSGFRIDAMKRRAARDPSAIPAMLEHGSMQMLNVLLPEVAAAAARADVRTALAMAADISGADLRSAYVTAILQVWAEEDPLAAMTYLEASDMRLYQPDGRTLRTIAAADPQRMLALAEEFPPQLRHATQSAALTALAETDVHAALAHMEGIAPGRDREQLMASIGAAYAQQDAGAALAWAHSQDPPSQQAVNGVVAGIAARRFNDALDIVLAEVQSAARPGIDYAQALTAGTLFQAVNADPANVAYLLDRLVASGDATLRSRAAAGAMVWAQHQPENAIDWAIANLDAIGATGLRSLAQRVATQEPALATNTIDRLPAGEARSVWIANMAEAISVTDPHGAISFLQQHRPESGYGASATDVFRRLVTTDPAAIARLAANTENPQTTTLIATVWSRQDAAAAERWVLDLPSGDMRDHALGGHLGGTLGSPQFNRALFDRFSSDATRQQVASSLALSLAAIDMPAARELIDTYITDPGLRQRTDAQLARGGAMPVTTPLPAGPQFQTTR